MKNVKKKAPFPYKVFWLVMVLAPVFLVGTLLFGYYQMGRMEDGILEVCAAQQDAYVDLVVSQINLKENRNNAQIITEILGTLDASSERYWTFSSQDTMLFVKDVLETNRYKGFNAASYYSSDSARAFFSRLQVNRSSHTRITLGGKEYIASGIAFEYQGAPYKLCLLTNRNVLLENNSFLSAKTQLWTILFFLLVLASVVPVSLALMLRSLQNKESLAEDTIRQLNARVSELDDQLIRDNLYNTENGAWDEQAMGQFVESLEKKQIKEVVLIYIYTPSQEERDRILALAPYTLSKQVLRFKVRESNLLLLFLGIKEDPAVLSVIPLLNAETKIIRIAVAGTPEHPSLRRTVKELLSCDRESEGL